MKKKELETFRAKSVDDLKKLIEDRKDEFIRISAEIKVGKEKNLKKAKNLRHEISQLNTLLREKIIFESESKVKE